MSVLSDVQICNLALDAAGCRSSISSLAENSNEARVLARQYAPALSAILQAAHWNFARIQKPLTLLRDATKTPPDAVPQPWLYEYAYPSDCAQGRYVLPLMQGNPASAAGGQSLPYWIGQPVRFLVSSDDDSAGNAIKVILANQPNAIFVYTRMVTDTGMFDDQFTRAFANYLAHLICIPLSGDKSLMKINYEIANQTIKMAQVSNGNEGLTVMDSMPDWIRVRGYASDWAFPPGSFYTIQPQALTQIS